MIQFPTDIAAVFHEFRTAEFTTLAKDNSPITWPVTTLYQPGEGQFVFGTSIGMPQKAFNVQRCPRVSLFFSDPTGSGLKTPPAVLVQGDAAAPDTLAVDTPETRALMRLVMTRQPVSAGYLQSKLMQRLFDWYYMRILIYVRPRRVLWWENGDFKHPPQVMELAHTAHDPAGQGHRAHTQAAAEVKWDAILKNLGDFPSAVLTAVDGTGYPFSVRTRASLDVEQPRLWLEPPQDTPFPAGPAALLFHKHDAQFGNLKSFLLRGRLTQEAPSWFFHPERFIPGMNMGGLAGMVRYVRGSRKNAKDYLEKRGIARPDIPWGDIQKLWEEVKKEQAAGKEPS